MFLMFNFHPRMKTINLGKVPHHANEVHRIPLPDGVPKPPMLALFCGKRGQGKSTAAVRLLHYYLNYKKEPVFHSNLTFVVSPTADSQWHLWNHLDLQEENVFTASTQDEVKTIITNIIELLEGEREKYEEDQAYIEAYKRLTQNKSLTLEQEMLLDSRDCQPLTQADAHPWPRPMLVLDDLSHMKILDSKWFVSLCLRHRHVAGGVSLSMMIICQSLRGGLSRVVRQNCSLIVLFSTHDHTAKDDLYQECSHVLEKEEFHALFDDATEDFHSFLAVDLTQRNPNQIFSRDFQHWYEIRTLAPQSEDIDASVRVGKDDKSESKKEEEVTTKKQRRKKQGHGEKEDN